MFGNNYMSQKDALITAGLIPWICGAFLILYLELTAPPPYRKPHEVGDLIWTGDRGIFSMRRYIIIEIEGVVFTLEDTETGEIIVKELKRQ